MVETRRASEDCAGSCGLPGFGGERVRVVFGEDAVHLFDQVRPLERQVSVAVFKPT